jgi:Tol biopolymer transport system component
MRRFAGAVATIAATCVVLFAAHPALATYPGKNGRISFSLDTGSGLQINTIRPNGRGLQQVTSVTGSALDSDWSPDGTKIVFDTDPSGETFPCRLGIMNADGSDLVDLTPKRVVANGGCAYNPSFTPNGKRVVFVQQRCHNEIKCPRTIKSMDLQGRDRRRILRHWTLFAPGDYDLHGLRVSPDGRTVLFVVVNESGIIVNGVHGNRKALYSVRMNGTHLRQVVPFRFDVCSCPADWAPNGKRIVSSSQAGPTPVPGVPSNLFTVRPDGTGLLYLTHSHDAGVYISVGSYSPNGRWIMFKRVTAKGAYRLMKIHPSGKGAAIITTLMANFLGRDWGPLAS